MLSKIDRVQLAVPDCEAAAKGWIELLDAVPDGEDRIAGLSARRFRLRIGTGIVELLEPDGRGAVAEAVAKRGAHLFAAGASSADLVELADRLAAKGRTPLAEGGQLHLSEADTGITGLRMVLSAAEERERVGLIDYLYEATVLSADTEGLTRQLNELMGLDERNYTEITSEVFGYRGTLTLFEDGHLDRLEVITPTIQGTTMERYFSKFGQSLYMAFAETSDIRVIEERAIATGAGHTVDRPADRPSHLAADQLWLHPRALGGMMLGLSRPTMAWTWSGAPERVEPLENETAKP
tara:strand:+ start:161603 stop:162487 length:885 start_codon:yes stop_codon:yes gene_type:complete